MNRSRQRLALQADFYDAHKKYPKRASICAKLWMYPIVEWHGHLPVGVEVDFAAWPAVSLGLLVRPNSGLVWAPPPSPCPRAPMFSTFHGHKQVGIGALHREGEAIRMPSPPPERGALTRSCWAGGWGGGGAGLPAEVQIPVYETPRNGNGLFETLAC